LLIDCAEIAIGLGWHVVAVVSEDDRVTDWAQQRQLRTVGWSDFETDVNVRAECLFSLVNPRILGSDVLDRFRFSANFHGNWSSLKGAGLVNPLVRGLCSGFCPFPGSVRAYAVEGSVSRLDRRSTPKGPWP